MTIGPTVWIYNADIINSEKTMGISTSVYWFCAFIIGLAFPSVKDSIGIYSIFWIFAGTCFLAFIYCKIDLIETFGLSTNEINLAFEKEFVNHM